ncbi:MAG: prepilin-type N-terminal cleavage/methylation domain-containing protein, partial [Candidatus Omnitrophica bacterium]|nr:prepilin-type N-terminal cleavage/methylation domain-containing protein [Candidatus Omnitrophota bacterium]
MRMTQLQRKNPGSLKGFTLIEVMVTVLIFAILAGAINMVLLVGQSSWHAN